MSTNLATIQALRERFARGEQETTCFVMVMGIAGAFAITEDDLRLIDREHIAFTIHRNERGVNAEAFYRLVAIANRLCSQDQVDTPVLDSDSSRPPSPVV